MHHNVSSLRQFLLESQALVVLTGAGISTASGIPDYRDDNGDWKHQQPIQFPDFVKSAAIRRRYWTRSYVGWRRFGNAQPNAAHQALAELESHGTIRTLITQNVDQLHRRAGSQRVIDLHGDLTIVRCLDCNSLESRFEFQVRLERANDGWESRFVQLKPDGDAELEPGSDAGFVVPACADCGGTLKPDVVMFGESVPRERVQTASAEIAEADGLLVVGSSLMLYSGFRFARQAAQKNVPIVIVNRGRTRADAFAALKVEVDCTVALPAATAQLDVADSR